MNVQSATHAARPLTPGVNLNSAKPHPTIDRAAQKNTQPDATPATGGGTTDVIDSSVDGDERGVLQLLEGGHFRGVADVRLRINFFEELSARAAQDAAGAATDNASDLIVGINVQVDAVANTYALDDDAQTAFDEAQTVLDSAINEAVEQFGPSADGDALEQSVRIAFESFLDSLREFLPLQTVKLAEGDASFQLAATSTDALVTDANDTPVLDEQPVNSPDGAIVDPLAEVISAFEQALTTFLSSIGSTAPLADPAPANGNGQAYAKFLEVYNELRGDQPAVDEVG